MISGVLHLRRNGGGSPILHLHGVGGSGLLFQTVVQRLGTGYDHLRPDLLGYGYSPKPGGAYTVARHVEALHEVVVAQRLDEPMVVVGLSMGSILGLEYAARWPAEVRGVVAAGMPLYLDEGQARRDLRHNLWAGLSLRAPRVARALITPLWGLGRRSTVMSKLLAPRMYAGEVARESMMATYHAFASTLRECLVDQRVPELLDLTAAIPKAFVHGSDDRWCPAERVAALTGHRVGCTFEVLDGIGHNTVVLDPDRTAAAVAGLLERL
jgi:pimeloyl-ACP methyl ester carboxylesterase